MGYSGKAINVWVTAGVLLVLAGSADMASAEDRQATGRWTIRLSGVIAHYAGELGQRGHISATYTAIDDEVAGLGLAVEYRLFRRFGIELSTVQFADPAFDRYLHTSAGGFRRPGKLRLRPVLFGLNVHLTPDRPVDLYAGLLYGEVLFGTLGRFNIEDDDDVLGLQLAVDRSFARSHWAFHADLRYLDVLVRFEHRSGFFPLDSVSLAAGAAYRF